ncbi:hypothetical protein G4B88_003646 [Cannabis sativa]|uniref:Uncharacterized protein n=1 Tax=Cannabis sativa TaxID=3483 RepID=A0A7J6F133_CANSA|nr:hypothetical protein G4B88_003646 [Cannabis sativa]
MKSVTFRRGPRPLRRRQVQDKMIYESHRQGPPSAKSPSHVQDKMIYESHRQGPPSDSIQQFSPYIPL